MKVRLTTTQTSASLEKRTLYLLHWHRTLAVDVVCVMRFRVVQYEHHSRDTGLIRMKLPGAFAHFAQLVIQPRRLDWDIIWVQIHKHSEIKTTFSKSYTLWSLWQLFSYVLLYTKSDLFQYFEYWNPSLLISCYFEWLVDPTHHIKLHRLYVAIPLVRGVCMDVS